MNTVYVSGSFDDLRSRQVRYLDEASRFGMVHVLLWSDEVTRALTGAAPKFPQAERRYFVEAIRYVDRVSLVNDHRDANHLPVALVTPDSTWAVTEEMDHQAKLDFCRSTGMNYQVVPEQKLHRFPRRRLSSLVHPGERKKVLVTGCYDWLHTGHVRFFEEASQLGDLYVVIGSDANVRLLKGEGHPLYPEPERLYMVKSMAFVTDALVASGMGWLDAEPEIAQIRPDCYVVNGDGDKPEKRAFCLEQGIEYVVLSRTPKEGLPRRASTDLRGF